MSRSIPHHQGELVPLLHLQDVRALMNLIQRKSTQTLLARFSFFQVFQTKLVGRLVLGWLQMLLKFVLKLFDVVANLINLLVRRFLILGVTSLVSVLELLNHVDCEHGLVVQVNLDVKHLLQTIFVLIY